MRMGIKFGVENNLQTSLERARCIAHSENLSFVPIDEIVKESNQKRDSFLKMGDRRVNKCAQNFVQDSDVEYEDEIDDSESSDTDNSDTSIIDINSDKLKNKSYSKYYNNLTTEQKLAYLQILDLFGKRDCAAVTINSRSGTGKTFLLTAITKTFAKSVRFITFRRDQASEISLKLKDSATAYTYISFYTKCFQLSYIRALQLFNTSEANDVDLLYKLILYSRKYLNDGTKIIVVDSCTLPSATMLLLLFIVSLKHRVHIIFSGNKTQLSAMHKTSLHNRTNFDIIDLLSDKTVTKLSDKRSIDKMLNSKLSRFRKMIEQNRPKNEVPFTFNLRYYLYCCFRSKYFVDENFDVLYMSQYHHNITDRLQRFINHLETSGTKYIIAPFYIKESTNFVPISTKERGKFFPGLILAEGYKYFHVNKNGLHSVVLLEQITQSDNNKDHTLLVRFLHDNSNHTLTVGEINFYQILPALRTWLVGSYQKLYQYPLRPYTLTYHAALGRTFDKEMVELSADCSLANAIYVGLCCVQKYKNIKKIHADHDLPSFVVTDYMRKEQNDETYYYRCRTDMSHDEKEAIMRYVREKRPNNFIDNIQWNTVTTVSSFEKKKLRSFTRILRSVYEAPSKKSKNTGETRLMKIAEFVAFHPTMILDTVAKAPGTDVEKFNKTVKDPEYRKSDAYIRLKKEYTDWCKCDNEE